MLEYYSDKFAPKTKLQNCLLLLGEHAAKKQNAKTSTGFLKRGEYIENEKPLLNLYDIKVFFQN